MLWRRGTEDVQGSDQAAGSMEMRAGQEAADPSGSAAGRQNLADERVRQAAL